MCDGGDEDCNPATLGFLDGDGDGASPSAYSNPQPDGSTLRGPDCNDDDPAIRPGAPNGPMLGCDGIDNDCNGSVDVGCPCTTGSIVDCGAPEELAMVGQCRPGIQTCIDGALTEVCSGATHPTEEFCDGRDNNCDGEIDEGAKDTYYPDNDGDGFGDPAGAPALACSPPTGFVRDHSDRDDTNSAIHPGAAEVCDAAGASGSADENCDGTDENCNGTTDEGVKTTYYPDSDGDGFGAATGGVAACAQPAGYVANTTDCADGNAGRHPGATELRNGIDDTCVGGTDEGCLCTDGATQACGMTSVGVCVDGTQACIGGAWSGCTAYVGPVSEACNGIDDDCDGTIDNGFTCRLGQTRSCTTAHGVTGGTQGCLPNCGGWTACSHAEVCDGFDDDLDGVADQTFACIQGQPTLCTNSCGETTVNGVCTNSCAVPAPSACFTTCEICNYCDDDGNSTTTDELIASGVSNVITNSRDYDL